ncbi:MAG: ribosome biogenesis GTPase Der [Ignavibacteriae bacterium]|nr:MAG: ribosome biogenesis GTPase Der [Ignavibacteriota bacterium]
MSAHIVAIVGRPNVGKSTLFNRIFGSREAIVFDTPGVTRDRRYAEAEWTGKSFTMIDTGGFVPKSNDVFEKAIREQATIAIEEADAIVFVVDGIEGLTPLDKEIAEILRRSDKPIHLIVNKIDSVQRENATAEFYALGLGEPIGIAALGGRQIGDFLDLITSDIKKEPRVKKEKRLRLAVIGKPNVGKSSLVNSLIGKTRQVVTEIPGTTRDPIDTILEYEGEEIILVDTAGLRKKSRISESIEFYSTIRTLHAIERCDVAVILFDATQGVDKQDLQIVDATMERHRSAIIVVNKWDLVEKETNTARQYVLAIEKNLGLYDFLPVIFVSALTKQRITKVIEKAKEVHAQQSRRITTSALNKSIMVDIQITPPKSSTSRDIKIKFVTQIKTNPPMFCFFCNYPKLVQESYKRFLANKLREHFGFPGVPLGIVFKEK